MPAANGDFVINIEHDPPQAGVSVVLCTVLT